MNEGETLISFLPPIVDCVLPDDDVPDVEVTPEAAERCVTARCPIRAPAAPSPNSVAGVFTRNLQLSTAARLNEKDPRIVAKLDQPFGVENLTQCLYSTPSLHHILLPLWKSGFLVWCDVDWRSLCAAHYPARVLRELLQECGTVCFQPLRGYPAGWESETVVNTDRVRMATAAFLHFNGSVADLVRWIGGPHVGAHRDHQAIFRRLESTSVDPHIIDDLRRILIHGVSGCCDASSTEEHFSACCCHCGNHSTLTEEPDKTLTVLVKDNQKGFTLRSDPRTVLLMPHCHLTPQGVMDLRSTFKSPCPVVDSGFRPHPWCFAINDWTDKVNGPPLTFATAEVELMIWLCNLCVTYPNKELHMAEDDVSGAFCFVKCPKPGLPSLESAEWALCPQCWRDFRRQCIPI